MKDRLFLIILDSADIGLIRKWTSLGLLPNLKAMLEGGKVRELGNYPVYRNEAPWESFLTGCFPNQTGYWSAIRYNHEKYNLSFQGGYPFEKYLPFYALAENSRITIFDLPHTGRLFPGLPGVQVLGWGAHFALCNGISAPGDLYGELEKKFGTHDAVKIQNRGTWWDSEFLSRFRNTLLEGLKKSGRIHRFLVKNYPADLTILSFSELHTASHHYWHLTDPGHPLYGKNDPPLPDFLREIYEHTDRELGRILETIPSSSSVMVASPMGAGPNWYTTNSKVFLPELLFRWSFPGKKLFVNSEKYPTSPVIPGENHWIKTLWSEYYSHLPPDWVPGLFHPLFRSLASIRKIRYPFYGSRMVGQLQWQPSRWYRPWWKKMKAFAIPGYGDGYIRINRKGRDPKGIVPESEIEDFGRELTEKLMALRNPDTGEPVVEKVIPSTELDNLSAPPDADLTVIWKDFPNDRIDDGEGNLLGPIPHWKSGSHSLTGFMLSPDLPFNPENISPGASVIDAAPTILHLLNEKIPSYMRGKPIFNR